MTKAHEAEENYVIEAIKSNEPKAKDIKTETKPNGDMTFIFKVGRKTHKIGLTNLDYEMFIAKKKKPYVEPMQQYFKELEEATKEVKEKHADFLEEYQETISIETEKFAVGEINKYFSLESDLGLKK